MNELSTSIVSEIAGYLKPDVKPKLVDNGRVRSVSEIVADLLPLTELGNRCYQGIGKSEVDQFYTDLKHGGPPPELHLIKLLIDIVPQHVTISQNGDIHLNAEQLEGSLSNAFGCISTGKLSYSFTLRLANVDISEPFQLTDSIAFQKSSPAEIARKYPIERRITGVAQLTEENWLRHCVEVVFTRSGSPKDFQNDTGTEAMDSLVNSILHAFLFADTSIGTPHATHVLLESPTECYCHLRSMHVGWSAPPVMTEADIKQLKQAFDFLQELKSDHVLETCVDRLILGKKRGSHHPNRINSPNWNKIVDYVIAMETLFLTTNGSSADHELSYRFRLNCSTLLSECSSTSRLQLFHALKHLYSLRSKIVHGCNESTIAKPARQFIDAIDPGKSQSLNSITLLKTVASTVEKWLQSAMLHVSAMPTDERPYRQKDGWELRLWGTAGE